MPEGVWCWVSSPPSVKTQTSPSVWHIQELGLGRGIWTQAFHMVMDGFSSKLSCFFIFLSSTVILPPTVGWIFCSFPFPPPTRLASIEELQEQKVKLDLPPLFLLYFFWHPSLALLPSSSNSSSPAPTLPAQAAQRGGHAAPMEQPCMVAIRSSTARGGGSRNTKPEPRGSTWVGLNHPLMRSR